jgi:SPP1 gp7 family putative phage head morphogenesis protein
MSDILKASKKFKKELLANNDHALRAMAQTYAQAWKRVKPQFDQITKQIADAKKSGLEIKPSWLFRQQRYASLMIQMEEELLRYSQYATAMVGNLQAQALDMGLDHSLQQLKLSLGPIPDEVVKAGYGVAWNRPPHESLRNLVGFLQDGSPLTEKFAALPVDVAASIKEVFTSGLAQGWNPKKIAREIRRNYQDSLTNVLVTARTETMRSYRTAAHENYRANSDVCKGWIWNASKSNRTCAACWAMDGTFHELSEELNDHPAGRCSPIPVTKTWGELFPDLDLSGIKETAAQPWDTEDNFKKMPKADQLRVLGPGRWQMWNSGEVSLRDMAAVNKSKKWGDSVRPKTLKELRNNGEKAA